jgi:hypothetical protein
MMAFSKSKAMRSFRFPNGTFFGAYFGTKSGAGCAPK